MRSVSRRYPAVRCLALAALLALAAAPSLAVLADSPVECCAAGGCAEGACPKEARGLGGCATAGHGGHGGGPSAHGSHGHDGSSRHGPAIGHHRPAADLGAFFWLTVRTEPCPDVCGALQTSSRPDLAAAVSGAGRSAERPALVSDLRSPLSCLRAPDLDAGSPRGPPVLSS